VVRLNIKQVIGANPTEYITVGTDSAVTNSAFSLLEGDFTVPGRLKRGHSVILIIDRIPTMFDINPEWHAVYGLRRQMACIT